MVIWVGYYPAATGRVELSLQRLSSAEMSYNETNKGSAQLSWSCKPAFTLDVDHCRKSETFFFGNEPIFLRAELAENTVMFFCSVQLFNLISTSLSNFRI